MFVIVSRVSQLPPHGSWKPSINLSSCLTSLQVLMSEPNPDDPLMPELAELFRYNRDKVRSGALTQLWVKDWHFKQKPKKRNLIFWTLDSGLTISFGDW